VDMDTKKKFLRTEDLAQILQLQPDTISKWRRRGRGPKYVRVGGAVRYRPEDVDAWVQAGEVFNGRI